MTATSVPFAQRVKSLFRDLVVGLAYLYPVCLLALVGLLTWVGERFWMSGVLLYLPRWLFALPLPVLVLALLVVRRPRHLVTQLAALCILLFPLMGWVLPSAQAEALGVPRMRFLSCNGNNGTFGYRELAQDILSVKPDLVVMQEMLAHNEELADELRRELPRNEVRGEFLVATRYALGHTVEQRWISVAGEQRSARFVRYGVETPLGALAVYNVHPVSPRAAFYALRGQGFRKEIASGRLIAGANSAEMQDRSRHREAQVRAALDRASLEKVPVVLAGDFNLPSLSPVLSLFANAGYRDGFVEAGAGFGYTYPADKRIPPFLRLDRIWAGKQLRFASFHVLPTRFSDHWCVYADLSRTK